MWPIDPNEFEPLLQVPENHDRSESSYFVCIDGKVACISESGVPRPVNWDEYRWLDITIHSEHYMGQFRGHACYAVEGSGRLPDGYALAGLREWLGRVDADLFYLAGRAKQIVEWHTTNQYCGRCGKEMENHPEDRAKICNHCHLINYPRLSPSIIVLVRRDQEMLLARNVNWPQGRYSTLAGFVEPGESIEQTVHREVFEEVALMVKNVRYLGSQSWPFPNSLMLGFHATYAGGDIVCQESEIAEARWFRWDDLPNVPPSTAISGWLIDDFVTEIRDDH